MNYNYNLKNAENAENTEIESTIRSTSGLATTPAVENKIPNVNNLIKKTDYDAKP